MALADSVRFSIIRESVEGQIPATPNWLELRMTGDSIVWETDNSPSPELNASRVLTGVLRNGGAVRGSIETAFSRSTAYEQMLEGIFGAAFDAVQPDELVPGTTLYTYSIEKRYVDEGGGYSYHRFSGVSFSAVAISVQPNQAVTASWTVVGGKFATDTIEVVGSTYTPPSPDAIAAPPMMGQDLVVDFKNAPLAPNCFQAYELTLDSQNIAGACIGIEGETDLALGEFQAPMTATVVYKGLPITDQWLSDAAAPFDCSLFDTAITPNQNFYQFVFPAVRIVSAGTPTPSKGEIVVQPIELMAVADASGSFVTLTRGTQ